MKKILLNVRTTEKRMVLLDGNSVKELWIEQPGQESNVGNIYRGRVINVVPGMQAAFVDIGADQNGFIQRKDLGGTHKQSISSIVHQGQELIVQVIKEGVGDKGPKLTSVVELAGQCVVYLPEGNYIAVSKKIHTQEKQNELRQFGEEICQNKEGLIFRTASEDVPCDDIEKEIIMLRKKWEELIAVKDKKVPNVIYQHSQFYDRILREASLKLLDEIIVDDLGTVQELKRLLKPYGDYAERVIYSSDKEDLFNKYNIQAEIDKGLKTQIWLKNGASLIIEQTEALTVIDVNTSKFTGKLDKGDTILKTNQIAAVEIARQLKLRDIGGMIFLDFINMKQKVDQEQVTRVLQEELKKDLNSTRVFGFTNLGLVEMTRKRVRPSLQQKLTTTCPTCNGAGYILSPETVAFKLERELWELKGMDKEAVWVEVPAGLKDVFSKKHQIRLEEALNYQLFVTINKDLEQSYTIRHVGSIKEIEQRIH